MPLKFVLHETLERENITKYQVSKIGRLRPNLLTEICSGKTSRLSVESLDAIIETLTYLTNKQHDITSVMVYEPPAAPDAE